MIEMAPEVDLGRDKARMKNVDDATRQTLTARTILDRLYGPRDEEAWNLQLLADEVGMGKTFVALGVVYSLLSALRAGRATELGCARDAPVLVIAPSSTLANKWEREVKEFTRRCMEPHDAEAANWFTSEIAHRPDDLARILRNPGPRAVVITYMNVLNSRSKLRNYDLKRRATLSALFRIWGNRLPNEDRARLLKGAPDGWPRDPAELDRFTEGERALLATGSVDQLVKNLRAVIESDGEACTRADGLLDGCKDLAAKYTRNREERFGELSAGLNLLYRRAAFVGIETRLPLVVVDEAHNWKNGPIAGTNGYEGFRAWIAPLTRRALLLTATPFQLRPAEMLELIRVGETIRPFESIEESDLAKKRVEQHREKVIDPVLQRAAWQSRVFAKAWAALTPSAASRLPNAWGSPAVVEARGKLKAIAHAKGAATEGELSPCVDQVITHVEEDLRSMIRAGLHLYARNEDASQELGAFVIRHRRPTAHRSIAVGAEFVSRNATFENRPDRHLLHASEGIEVTGDGELPHYLLMRCVSEMKEGKGRSSLGTALTGCYSTLLSSADGRSLRTKLAKGPGKAYLDLLNELVTEENDPDHPKVANVVNEVMSAWRAGMKTLVFCFRTHTAARLTQIIEAAINKELDERRASITGGADNLRNLRSRLTRRDDELIVLGLDRVLWSTLWAARSETVALPEIDQSDFVPTDEELRTIAELALRFEVRMDGADIDRVFVHRAVEHVVALRLAARKTGGAWFKRLLAEMCSPRWVQYPYGVDPTVRKEGDASSLSEGQDGGDEDVEVGLDAKGVHIVYTERRPPEPRAIDELAAALVLRRKRAADQGALSVFDSYARSPNFWLGSDPTRATAAGTDRSSETLTTLHTQLLLLSRNQKGQFEWRERAAVLQVLRRVVLRESVLLRILPEKADIAETGWATTLVDALFRLLPNQEESMADRVAVFVEDVQSATGSVFDPATMRYSMYEGARLKGSEQIALVRGDTAADLRERRFAGFNSPLLPEVLVCTSVGQEGIDLHRHCRHVIHYDLAWNPAVLEQRTGRVDRIGSKAFRERGLGGRAFLDIGVPFLAGTYDERMYEELRIRAQTFEVLTGGDVTADDREGAEGESAEGEEVGLEHSMLPKEMLEDLRVRLHVWSAGDV